MLLGTCSKCNRSSLLVRDGQLTAHFSNSQFCSNSVPENVHQSTTPAYIDNPTLTFFESMMNMLDMLEGK